MPRASIIPMFIREVLGPRTLPREPEPDLIMDGTDQVESYAAAGRIDGVMAAAYLFHSARISQVIQGCSFVADLGCGPATQLAQVASLNPNTRFIGYDLSALMIESARAHVQARSLGNVEFRCADIAALEEVPTASFDGVISTMALHHLPSKDHLRACFRQINRILRPGGALYLVDFGRLKSLRTVLYFAYMNSMRQPHLFSLDYERSLRAAFLYDEIAEISSKELPSHVRVFATFQVPFLTIVKSEDRALPPTIIERLRQMRHALPAMYRRDLFDLRMFLRLGGLKNDPFRAMLRWRKLRPTSDRPPRGLAGFTVDER